MPAVKIKEIIKNKLGQGIGIYAYVLYEISDHVIQERQRKCVLKS